MDSFRHQGHPLYVRPTAETFAYQNLYGTVRSAPRVRPPLEMDNPSSNAKPKKSFNFLPWKKGNKVKSEDPPQATLSRHNKYKFGSVSALPSGGLDWESSYSLSPSYSSSDLKNASVRSVGQRVRGLITSPWESYNGNNNNHKSDQVDYKKGGLLVDGSTTRSFQLDQQPTSCSCQKKKSGPFGTMTLSSLKSNKCNCGFSSVRSTRGFAPQPPSRRRSILPETNALYAVHEDRIPVGPVMGRREESAYGTLSGRNGKYRAPAPPTNHYSQPSMRPSNFLKTRDPYGSVASRKSILECDVTAYDLVKSNGKDFQNDSDPDDDLSNNVLESPVKKTELKSDNSPSPVSSESESGIYSHSSSIRVGGQGMKLFNSSDGNSSPQAIYSEGSKTNSVDSRTSSWSNSSLSDDGIYSLPEPDYDDADLREPDPVLRLDSKIYSTNGMRKYPSGSYLDRSYTPSLISRDSYESPKYPTIRKATSMMSLAGSNLGPDSSTLKRRSKPPTIPEVPTSAPSSIPPPPPPPPPPPDFKFSPSTIKVNTNNTASVSRVETKKPSNLGNDLTSSLASELSEKLKSKQPLLKKNVVKPKEPMKVNAHNPYAEVKSILKKVTSPPAEDTSEGSTPQVSEKKKRVQFKSLSNESLAVERHQSLPSSDEEWEEARDTFSDEEPSSRQKNNFKTAEEMLGSASSKVAADKTTGKPADSKSQCPPKSFPIPRPSHPPPPPPLSRPLAATPKSFSHCDLRVTSEVSRLRPKFNIRPAHDRTPLRSRLASTADVPAEHSSSSVPKNGVSSPAASPEATTSPRGKPTPGDYPATHSTSGDRTATTNSPSAEQSDTISRTSTTDLHEQISQTFCKEQTDPDTYKETFGQCSTVSQPSADDQLGISGSASDHSDSTLVSSSFDQPMTIPRPSIGQTSSSSQMPSSDALAVDSRPSSTKKSFYQPLIGLSTTSLLNDFINRLPDSVGDCNSETEKTVNYYFDSETIAEEDDIKEDDNSSLYGDVVRPNGGCDLEVSSTNLQGNKLPSTETAEPACNNSNYPPQNSPTPPPLPTTLPPLPPKRHPSTKLSSGAQCKLTSSNNSLTNNEKSQILNGVYDHIRPKGTVTNEIACRKLNSNDTGCNTSNGDSEHLTNGDDYSFDAYADHWKADETNDEVYADSSSLYDTLPAKFIGESSSAEMYEGRRFSNGSTVVTISGGGEEHIYSSLNSDEIYEEVKEPDTMSIEDFETEASSPFRFGRHRRSFFEGASRAQILRFLESAKQRVRVTADIDDDILDDILDEEVHAAKTVRNTAIRGSNISSSSDASSVSCSSSASNTDISSDEPKTSDSNSEVDRSDSGVGSDTGTWNSRRACAAGKQDSHPVSSCADCDQPLDPCCHLVCEKCDKRRAERKEIVTEIVETEFKYGNDLQVIREEFKRPMEVAGLLSGDQIAGVFLNLDELADVSASFAASLQGALQLAEHNQDQDYMTVNIGQLFLENTSMLKTFEFYCIRQGGATSLLSSLEKERELLRIFLRVSQMENCALRRMNLAAFLVVPVQRVTRYPLLLDRLYKVTPYHHKDRERLREAQLKIELHLEQINQQTRGTSGTKIWRRISNLSASHRRPVSVSSDIGSIQLRKMALDVLGWSKEEIRFVLAGRVTWGGGGGEGGRSTRRGRSFKFSPAHALLATRGKPNALYRPDLATADAVLFPRDTGILDASLLLVREKNGKHSLAREPLSLGSCIVVSELEEEDIIELQEHTTRDSVFLKAECRSDAQEWLKQLRYHAKDLGQWKRRRNAFANIMINGMIVRQ